MTPRFETRQFVSRAAHVDEPPLPVFPQTPNAHHPGRTMANPPKGAKAKPLGPNGSPVKSTASTCPHRSSIPTARFAHHHDARSNARGRSYRGDVRARADRPFPFLPVRSGPQEDPNRAHRGRAQPTGAFADRPDPDPPRVRGSNARVVAESACFSPRNLPNPCRTGRRLFRVRNRRTKR